MRELDLYYALGDDEVVFDFSAWRYDDPVHDRVGEPFVMGASEMIDVLRLLDGLPEQRWPFTLCFSGEPFEGAHTIDRITEDGWYRFGEEEFWLCPALLDWFEKAPEKIYVRAVDAGLRCTIPPSLQYPRI